MQNLLTLGDIGVLTKPGLDCIQYLYKAYPCKFKQFMTLRTSGKAVEYYAEMTPLNAGASFGDGENIPMGAPSNFGEAYAKHKNYGVGFAVTRNTVADNIYGEYFPRGIQCITYNLRNVKEKQAIGIFDNAFDTQGLPEYTIGVDGQPMCSANHLTSVGTYSNLVQPSDLNETSAEAMIVAGQNLVDASGQRIMIQCKKYPVGLPNQFIVLILSGSQFQPSTSNNAVNALSYGDYVNQGYIVNPFMDVPTNYFMLTDHEPGLIHYVREDLIIETSTDSRNRNLGFYGSERYIDVCYNPRAVIGCQGNGG